MYYLIMAEDAENSSEQRKQNRVAHLQRLHVLNQQGRLLLAGPHMAEEQAMGQQDHYSGSLIVADFENLAEAQKWAEADPYMAAGVYRNILVRPFNKVLP